MRTDLLGRIDAHLEDVRRRLEREWGPGWQRQRFGPGGVVFAHRGSRTSVIVSIAPHEDEEWVHASIAHPDRDPTYSELVILHRVVFPNAWAYQVFAPVEAHVNIHEHALHLWGRFDGEPVLPNFGEFGTI